MNHSLFLVFYATMIYSTLECKSLLVLYDAILIFFTDIGFSFTHLEALIKRVIHEMSNVSFKALHSVQEILLVDNTLRREPMVRKSM